MWREGALQLPDGVETGGVDESSVDLCGADIGMSAELRDSIDADTLRDHESGEGVAGDVESEVQVEPRRRSPAA